MSQVLGAWIYILMRLESIGFMGYPWARWDKEERQEASDSKKVFFISYEEHVQDKNRLKRESLHHPWPGVAYHFLKYITYEGRLKVI
jgi:hypothetical protein